MMNHKRSLNYYKLFYILVFFFYLSTVLSAEQDDIKAEVHTLSLQQWSVPRDAMTVLNMPAISATMKALTRQQNKKLVLRYPGGEVGMLWASELKGWLVSLGLSSSRIKIQAAGLKPDELELMIDKDSNH